MAEISLERSGLAQTAVVSVVTLIALVLLGLVFAYWTWAWLAPSPLARAQVEQASPRVESAYGLFGGARSNPLAIAPTGLAIKLLGIAAAAGGRRGYAVVQLEAREIRAVREGEDVAPGIRLAEVHADHVVLARNGARETLAWPEKNAGNREKLAPPGNNNMTRESVALPPASTPAESPARRDRDRDR